MWPLIQTNWNQLLQALWSSKQNHFGYIPLIILELWLCGCPCVSSEWPSVLFWSMLLGKCRLQESVLLLVSHFVMIKNSKGDNFETASHWFIHSTNLIEQQQSTRYHIKFYQRSNYVNKAWSLPCRNSNSTWQYSTRFISFSFSQWELLNPGYSETFPRKESN